MSNIDQYLAKTISVLQDRIDKLEALKGAGRDVAQILADIQRIFGDDDSSWLLDAHIELNGEAPIDLLGREETKPVRELLGRFKYGSAV